MIKHIPVQPSYKRDNGLWNLETLSLPLAEHLDVKERNVVYVPAGQQAGNHKHPRTEAFIGIGEDLWLVWIDDEGATHEEKMMVDGGQLNLFVVEPFTPHAVVNKAQAFAVIVEFTDGPNVDVERVEVVRDHTV